MCHLSVSGGRNLRMQVVTSLSRAIAVAHVKSSKFLLHDPQAIGIQC